MRIEIITSLDEFRSLRDNWERVYDADPHAQLFLSWTWLYGWLPKLRDPWVILAARDEHADDHGFAAFWPLRIETHAADNGLLVNEIKMAGNHAADYTGLICLPAAEARAVAAFARQLKEMNWALLHLDNLRSPEQRLRQLLAYFPKSTFRQEDVKRINASDGIDNCICPYAALPADWESYLAGLSTNTRQKLRRLLRLVDGKGDYRVTVATADTIVRDVDILLHFWRKKWEPRKGSAAESIAATNRLMLLRSFELGLVYLPMVWQGERPLVALATLTDPVKRAFLFYITGRDETFDGPPLGVMLHAYSIRHAIANGFSCYDFLRGNEAYKYSFASREERIRCVKIQTRSGQNLGGRLDPRTVSDALDIVTKLHQGGKLAEAERGYRQILRSEPRHADTLHRFGQLLSQRHNVAEAKRVFTLLTRVRPDAPKAWFCLAQACEALGQTVEAVKAYRAVAEIEPRFPGVAQKLADLAPAGAQGAPPLAAPPAAVQPEAVQRI